MADPHLSKATYKDSNYQRYIEAPLCSSGLGFAENYTAIKKVTIFPCRYIGTQGEGCIRAVEVLYEGIGPTGCAATCPDLK